MAGEHQCPRWCGESARELGVVVVLSNTESRHAVQATRSQAGAASTEPSSEGDVYEGLADNPRMAIHKTRSIYLSDVTVFQELIPWERNKQCLPPH